jgi:hypothetical protein
MKRKVESGVFKPTQSRFESKSEATSKAAREMSDKENLARDAKIARLKAARIAQEAELAAAAPPPVKEKKSRKKPA